jgi:hypothetical protein
MVHKFGRRPVAGASASEVWDGNTDYTFTTTAQPYYTSSDQSSDTGQLRVFGLDEDFNTVETVVTLSGQTKVWIADGDNFMRVFRAFNDGDTTFSGNVFIYEDDTVVAGEPQTTSKIRAKIIPPNNQTEMAIYTVPAGKTAYVRKFTIYPAAVTNRIVDGSLFVREFGKVFRLRHRTLVSTAPFSNMSDCATIIPEKSDIVVKASVNTGTSEVVADFDLLLEDND